MPFDNVLGKPGYCRTCRSSSFVLEPGGCGYCQGKLRQAAQQEMEKAQKLGFRTMLDNSEYAGDNVVQAFRKEHDK